MATTKDMAKDPVCGMDLDPPSDDRTAMHRGHTYFFCSTRCQEAFQANPDGYLDPDYVPPVDGHGH